MKSPLRPIKIIHYASIIDVTSQGYLASGWPEENTIHYFNWNGYLQWSLAAPVNIDRGNLDPLNGHLDIIQDISYSWISLDYAQCHFAQGNEFDKCNRKIDMMHRLYRLSSHDRYLGIIDFPPHAIRLSVYQQNLFQWQQTYMLTSYGLFSGHAVIDLLIDDQGRVLLYEPHAINDHAQETTSPSKALPHSHLLALVDHGKITTANLQPIMEQMVASYIQTIPKPAILPTHTWMNSYSCASSPYRQYIMQTEEYDNAPLARLKVYMYPNQLHASILAFTTSQAEQDFAKIIFPNGEKMLYLLRNDMYVSDYLGSIIFAPDGHHLLIDGNNGWGLFEY